MIQHDMMLFDHGMPRADGTREPTSSAPRPTSTSSSRSTSKFADRVRRSSRGRSHAPNEKYATDYPGRGRQPHMTNTDSDAVHGPGPAISLRENERGTQIGAGWDPHWHQPTDLYATFSDKDFRLGLNAAQTTLGAVARLTGAALVKSDGRYTNGSGVRAPASVRPSLTTSTASPG